ncbi:dipeptide/oligopeptide/nickel ABC transporter permease/ATP-binding protein [Curtobacterium pusillum]|uniref:Dipeptide/oligopeptide/nickel ABC transporter permease/ATP-binding protein n=1 Tax=Curtobacterium pusillum TaxID=69373 RepID=A0AAW3SZL9_9MICO|nr:dipeptide/oligopeptide/nickel ABC transporter permease/ATP-binding protein [Curtobacterium pusillum]MBA8989036.1 peptide/nickel transport system permease protein [Curtobacterium pusillum]NUU12513.1 dipeptide/oligopeptide/nickel ABC transporter permease/ATP-binding protein [Curtobacterium pusillum]GLK33024.1 dipeptide/oligopeptide/nickel ABC transporter ATP-binding protein [Curtobacterium pusillum]
MTGTTLAQPTVTTSPRTGLADRIVRNPLGLAALVVIAIIVLAGIVGPFVVPFDPNQSDLGNALQGPGGAHLLGTDSAGRDILSRLLFGARSTLIAAAVAAVVALGIGVPTGLLAGFYGRWFDSIASWCTNVLMSVPAIIILLTASAALGRSVWVSMTIFGILMSPGFFRITRTSVQAVRNELYVDAARVAGVSDVSIIGRHILSVVRAPVIIQTSIVAGIAISIQATLEFLGLGDPLAATWGVMLSEGFVNIYTAPLIAFWPGLVISITIGAFVILGNALRDALEDGPRVARRPAARRARRRPVRDSREARTPSPVTEPEEHLLTVTNLGVGYPQADGTVLEVVHRVDLHVDRGEVLGIVGESGSGKSQTAFSMLGLLPAEAEITHGAITFDGAPLVREGDVHADETLLSRLRGKRIAYIPQEPISNLDPNFTIGHQLVRPMVKLLGISRPEARRRALELLRTVGINDPDRTFAAYPHEVSGGMAQRVLIAGAVSCNPDLLIADEPTTALDVTVQAEVLDLLRRLQAEYRMGVVVVTHNFGVVADICDRVVVMQNGSLVEAGDVRSILRTPKDPYTENLLGALLEGKTPMTFLTKSEPPVVPAPTPAQKAAAR